MKNRSKLKNLGKKNKRGTYLFKLIYLSLILFFAATVFPLSSKAATSNDLTKPEYLFLGNETLPPMSYTKDRKRIGIVVDLAEAIKKHMNHSVRIDYMNWSKAQQMVLEGSADALFQINASEERKQIYDFSNPLLESEFSIFILSSQVGIDGINSLAGLQVGVEEKGLPIQILKRHPLIHIVVFPDIISGFHLLADSKIDAVVVDRWVGSFVIAENKIRGIRITGVPIEKSSSAIAVKKGNRALLDSINRALDEIRKDGTYARIIAKWEPKEVIFQTKEQYFRQKVILAAILCVLLIMIISGIFLIIEIKKRKQMEEALCQNQRMLSTLLSNLPGFVYRCKNEANWEMMYISDGCIAITGYTPDDLMKSKTISFNDLIHAEDQKRVWNTVQAGVQIKKSYQTEYRIITADGSQKHVLEQGLGIYADGNLSFLEGFITDITERKQAEKERATYVAQLEAQRVELKRFTYTVSHDLKSPIITIKGFLGMLVKDAEDGNIERLHSDIKRISTAATKMGDLLDDLLDLSRIGRVANELVDVSLDKLAHEVAETLHGPIGQRGVSLEIESGLPVVRGDHIRLYEVLQNLIENAIKFMGDQASPGIKIGSRIDDGETVCYVRDNGQGIDPAYADKIFGLFEQLDGRTGGTGIGLALVKSIIECHGGRVWVESEGPGCGSTFCFSIPLKRES